MESSRTRSANLVLNFSLVRFEDAEINAGCLPYGTDGDEVLKNLRTTRGSPYEYKTKSLLLVLLIS
jgi:hypothetical protein